jgi:hypothetical protein
MKRSQKVGGSQFPGGVVPTDRPHFHSGIFSDATDFSEGQIGRLANRSFRAREKGKSLQMLGESKKQLART